MNEKRRKEPAPNFEMPAHFAQLPVELLRELAWSLHLLVKGDEFLIKNLNAELAELRRLIEIQEERIVILIGQRDEALDAIPHGADILAEKWASALQNVVTQSVLAGVAAGEIEQKTRHAKVARAGRVAKLSGPVRDFALQRYDAGNWKSIADAARQLYPHVQDFAKPRGVVLSEDRFEKTLGGWLKSRKSTPLTG